ISLPSSTLPAIAYADDTCLLADNLADITESISTAKEYLTSIGLSINTDKSASLYNSVHGIPTTTTLTFLGVHFDQEGITDPPLDKLRQYLEALSNRFLKPEQRLYFLKVHLIPSFTHLLSLSR